MTDQPVLRRPLILVSVMAAFFMIAVEATIVSTAMPQIAGQLGDLHLYSWVFSAFLLTQTATTVVFGKLADMYGRKPVLLAGIAVFLVGSALCGFAWSIPSLIAFRLLQGVGAGAIQPVAITIIGDIYTIEERGRIQGYLASVWGISSVLGPLAGGLIVQHASWPWVFWVNIPIGLLACAGFYAFLHEQKVPKQQSVDVTGAALFAVAVAALMLALTEGGSSDTVIAIGAATVFVIATTLFVMQERRAKDPILAFGLWARRPILTANAATLFSGMTIIGLTTFLPMFVQGVLGRSALVAGFSLTVMVLGWPIGATVAARTFVHIGLRTPLLFGAALLPVGAATFLFLDPASSPILAGLGSAIVGLGMGFLSTSAIVIVQDSVGWSERGSATASNIFSRNLGSTLGAAALGALLNISLDYGGDAGNRIGYGQVRDLLSNPGVLDNVAAVRAALDHALHVTFWGIFGIALITLLLALFVPRITIGGKPQPDLSSDADAIGAPAMSASKG